MVAALYDPATGRILQVVMGSPAVIAADGRPFVEMSKMDETIDATHVVVNGAIVVKS